MYKSNRIEAWYVRNLPNVKNNRASRFFLHASVNRVDTNLIYFITDTMFYYLCRPIVNFHQIRRFANIRLKISFLISNNVWSRHLLSNLPSAQHYNSLQLRTKPNATTSPCNRCQGRSYCYVLFYYTDVETKMCVSMLRILLIYC